jgi:hypothetical protein
VFFLKENCMFYFRQQKKRCGSLSASSIIIAATRAGVTAINIYDR